MQLQGVEACFPTHGFRFKNLGFRVVTGVVVTLPGDGESLMQQQTSQYGLIAFIIGWVNICSFYRRREAQDGAFNPEWICRRVSQIGAFKSRLKATGAVMLSQGSRWLPS